MKLSIARSSSFFRTVVITIVAFGVVSCHDDISNPQLQKPVYSILGAGDAPPRSSEGRYSWLEMSDSMLWEYVALTDSIAYVGIKAPDKNRGLYRGKLLVTPSGRELALAKLAEMGLQVVEVDSLLPRVVARFATRDAHDWPGNVRELENVVERAVLLADGNSITPVAIPISVADPASEWSGVPVDAKTLVEAKKELRAEAVDRLERLFVLKALHAADWNVTHAAQNVGMQRTNFHALMRKHKISGTSDSEAPEDVSATV